MILYLQIFYCFKEKFEGEGDRGGGGGGGVSCFALISHHVCFPYIIILVLSKKVNVNNFPV